MARITKMNQPLVQQPLKTSASTGATLASLGINNAIPLMHGSQGCSAFAKVYLIQHLREPIPLQNTAIDQVAAVMGGDDNLLEALVVLCEKHNPDFIAVMTTGLTEMQGTDTYRVIMEFRKAFPEFAATRIVNMQTPDFVGSMQTGFAHAVDAMVRQLVQPPVLRASQRLQVNVLCSVGMTAADIEALKRYLEAFNLDAIMVPDLSLSLDGHLAERDYSAVSTGGTSVLEIEMMSSSIMTLVIGESLVPTAQWLQKRFNIPYHQCDMGMGMKSMDHLVEVMAKISGEAVPAWITRERKRLQDAMLDTHFLLSYEPVAIALEPDLAIGYTALLSEMGAKIPMVITTTEAKGLEKLQAEQVVVGDLSVLEPELTELSAVIGNTHVAGICEPEVPVIRAGYPCHDQFGNMDMLQFGYEGSRQRLFALANRLLQHHVDEVSPHVSAYKFDAGQVRQQGAAYEPV